ncbi:IS1182 family transposase [Comamonas aquatica]|uniref:IS1182 family transposase n=1 Tax=Comamonas aquatica TaxID=225991 RepID=A0AA43AYI9_9BURK|nr:IS1182 family transposase [Comamonas aquatica]MDH1428195.1 IS1182 family transposase [Comamonas aquatica]MDH1428787.1 IS1182 family transposase [Comamonas aquatica]MDH1428854.1 IS1182 family transposase [Comamonas aquatica]MDH1429414.1 IS1182 family transposase [Comamonas aquatica]MDH1429904.1 IS1182 family transposase [Comamonas aquatica]
MKRFIEGECRDQVTLLPECLDDFIGEDNPVRIVDAFVDELDLQALGFNRAAPASTGRPAYHPAVLLKLYIYGYLNRIQSSRRLEREAQRNVELMWLTGRLAPDFKTIADFRHHNGVGIRKVCSHFIGLCRELKLFSQAIVAIDGSKFKAVNNGDNNFSNGKIEGRKRQIEQSIQRYLDTLETADRTQPAEVEVKTKRLKEKIELLRLQMQKLEQIQEQIKAQPDGQISTVDPDSRVMISKGQGVVGYNVQAAVDTQNHLIVAHEVTNIGNDRAQLSKMAQAAKQEMAADNLQALADRGYFNGPEIKACEDAGIEAFVPKPLTSNAKADGRFDKSDFVYLSETDEYRCPAGESAIHRFNTVERSGLNVRVYWSSACIGCPQKSECTTSQYRRIRRWEHEDVLERMQERLNTKTDAMTVRRRTVEHVFGTLKHWMGSTHFLTKTLAHVGTEMSLHVLAYNFKRVMRILGAKNMMQAVRSVPA